MRSRSSRGEDAVSEVVGFLITFGIIAILLVASMLAFNQAQERAEARVVAIQVDSIAQRVAGVVVETGLFVESQDTAATTVVSILVELPNDLQGNGYQVTLTPGSVVVTSAKGTATQSVFGVGGGSFGLKLCPGDAGASAATYSHAAGGNLYVVYSTNPVASGGTNKCLGLSNTPVS